MTKSSRIYTPDPDGKIRGHVKITLLKELQRSETADMIREAEKRKQDKGA